MAGLTRPVASIVVPVRDRPVAILASVGSLLAQTYTSLEVLVVDDGSADDTAAVARAVRDPRVRVVELERSQGPSGARNAGAAEATGTYLAFLDSDDSVEADWLERMCAPMEDPNCAVVTCGFREVRGGATIGERRRIGALGPAFHNYAACFQAGTFLMRRSVFADVGGYAPELRFGENSELALRICTWAAARHATMATVEAPLLTWNVGLDRSHDFAVRGAAAEYTLAHHGGLLATDPRLLADHHAVAGTGAAHAHEWARARRQFFKAWRVRPLDWRAAGRLAAVLTPVWRTRHWR